MIEKIKKEIELAEESGQPYVYNEVLKGILDKYNNQEKYKWKCDICGDGFNNFHAQGFDNEIYCPLCYFKHELTNYKNAWEELEKMFVGTTHLGKLQTCKDELEKNIT